MPQTRKPNFTQVRSWLNEIHGAKTAASKAAKAYAENAETTHPIKDVDDGLEKATTGSHASENEKDQKERPVAGIVDETSEGGAPTQEDLALNIGVKAAPTGQAPEVEDDYKGKMKDPGTSSPMNADEVGDKYGSWIRKEAAELSGLANDILADIATGVGMGTTRPTATTRPAHKTAATNAAPTATTQTAIQAGYELAALMGLDKTAADSTTESVVAETIKQAQVGAERVGAYIISFMRESENILKQAADADAATEGEGGGDPAAGGGDPAALAAAAGGGGMPPSGGPEGGLPPGGPEALMGGGGGDPGAGAGGGGGGDNEAALQQLAMALMELGVSPDELQQLAAQGGGMGGGMGGPGGPGGGGPDAGAAPPGGPADMGGKIASAVKSYKRSGRFKFSEAKTAAERTQRNEMKRYILEIMGATRG